MALSVDINANTRQAQSQVKDLSKELDKYSDALDDMAKDADKNADKVERSFREMVKAADKLDASVKDIGDGGAKNLRKMSDAGEEAAGELRQNLGETFSSFRGDLEDLPQIAQDVFGGLAGSVTSMVGSFALAGGAAGIGLLIAGFQEIQKQEEERKQRIADWTATYIGGLSTMEDAIANFAAVEAIYTDSERLDTAKKNAENWGVSLSTAVNAMAGDKTALAVVNDNLAASEERVQEAVDKLNGGRLAGLSHDMRTLRDHTIQGRDSFNQLTSEMTEAEYYAAQYSNSLVQIAQGADSAQVSVDDLGNTVYELPDGQTIMIDAKTGQATTDVTKFKGDADGVITYLNGREVALSVKATVAEAERSVNNFITKNNGRSFTLNGRVRVSGESGWD